MADARLLKALRSRLGAAVRAGEPLARHTTLRVGGPAAALVTAEEPAHLVAVAEVCAAEGAPWLVLGRGSNLLVADDGWPGVVVRLGRGFRGVRIPSGPWPVGSEVEVEAGAAELMPVLARTVARHGLAGLEFGVAIPGTVGGAVRMNAGAMGAEMRDVLTGVDVVRLAAGGACEQLAAPQLQLSYRHSALPDDALVIRARLRLRAVEADELADTMRAYKRWRREHQPTNLPSCGSVFRNPEGDSAGRLIDSAGGKGLRAGGARVSEVHANFITTAPGARAADVYALVRRLQRLVAREHGVWLQPEVVMVGFPADDEPSGAAAGAGSEARGEVGA